MVYPGMPGMPGMHGMPPGFLYPGMPIIDVIRGVNFLFFGFNLIFLFSSWASKSRHGGWSHQEFCPEPANSF